MTYIVTRLCLRDTACIGVYPAECVVLGQPEEEWPWLYIDPDTQLEGGEQLDLTKDIMLNYDFFVLGPGYDAIEMEEEKIA